MDNMKLCLLLVLWLTSDCAVTLFEGRQCATQWDKFKCRFSKTKNIKTVLFQLTKKQQETKKVNISITKLKEEDAGIYTCTQPDDTTCQKPLEQTTYVKATSTISCCYEQLYDKSTFKFFCKEKGETCKEIVSTPSSPRSNVTFSEGSVHLSIDHVSSQDAGVYWCGFKTKINRNYELALQKHQLKVQNITTFMKSPKAGDNVTYWCKYKNSLTNVFICKGQDPSTCQILVSMDNKTDGKFSFKENKGGNITILVRNVTTRDTGTYWCGRRSDVDSGRQFFHRFYMNVVSPWTPAASTSVPTRSTCSSSKLHTPPPPPSQVRPILIPVIVVAIAVLLLVIVFISFYKLRRRNKDTEEKHRQCRVSEQTQECLCTSGAGDPTIQSASLYYATIHFQCSSSGGGNPVNHGSSACEYSTVKYVNDPTDVQPSGATADPLYATVQKPGRERVSGL